MYSIRPNEEVERNIKTSPAITANFLPNLYNIFAKIKFAANPPKSKQDKIKPTVPSLTFFVKETAGKKGKRAKFETSEKK